MSRPLVLVALVSLVACGGAETSQQADVNSERVKALEKDLAQLEERIAANEASTAANTTEMARVSAESADAAMGVSENAASLDALGTRVDGHDLALSQTGAALTGLEARLFDPDYGEIARVDEAIAANGIAIVTQAAEVAAVQSTVAGNSTAIAGLGATVAGMEAQVSAAVLQSTTNAVDIGANRVDIDANTADLIAVGNTADSNAVAVLSLQQQTTNLINTTNQHTIDLASNSGAIGVNAADIATIEANYITAADLAPLESDVAANASDIATIQTNYLGQLDDLFGYLSTDTATDTLLISGADLTVEGRVLSDTMIFRECAGGRYQCTPRECLAECQANGERMATTDEVLAWASAGNQECSWAWMIDRDNPTVPARAFPMYENRTTSGCGPQNTGVRPRFGNGVVLGTSWDDTSNYDCACAAD